MSFGVSPVNYSDSDSDGFVSLNSDSAQSTPIKILRDTGASQSLILADTLPFSEKSSSGTSVLIQGVECGFVNVGELCSIIIN